MSKISKNGYKYKISERCKNIVNVAKYKIQNNFNFNDNFDINDLIKQINIIREESKNINLSKTLSKNEKDKLKKDIHDKLDNLESYSSYGSKQKIKKG